MQAKVNLKLVDDVIKRWGSDPSFLIPMMQDIQDKYRYLPRPALVRLHEKLNIPLTRIAEVATFYKAFSLKPKGKWCIQVCMGTACHLRGGPRIADSFKRELGIEVNQTTDDMKFTLQTVNCVGACALAPVVKVNDEVHGQVSAEKVKKIIDAYAMRKK
jgi:NADH-quinone oxidoreductase subunit E